MEKHDTPIEQMAQIASEVTGVMVAGQTVGLQILAAEMQALTQLMPGMTQSAGDAPSDAEIESDFDNMPI